jgi:hypothetical protein
VSVVKIALAALLAASLPMALVALMRLLKIQRRWKNSLKH